MTAPRRVKGAPVIDVRIETNVQGTHLIWNVTASDGTKASGFAKCHADAMRDAAAFVEAMAQPRAPGSGIQAGILILTATWNT